MSTRQARKRAAIAVEERRNGESTWLGTLCDRCGASVDRRGLAAHKRGRACDAKKRANELRAEGLERLRVNTPTVLELEELGIDVSRERTGYVERDRRTQRSEIRYERWAPLWVARLCRLLVKEQAIDAIEAVHAVMKRDPEQGENLARLYEARAREKGG